MACITLFVQPVAMATTELARAIRYENAWTGQAESYGESNSLRMSWVVVIDSAGKRKLQMEWLQSADSR